MSKKIPNKSIKSRTNPQSGAFYVNPACPQDGDIKHTLPLYRFVYASQASLVLVVLLLSSFLLQGVERVHANELVDTANESTLSADSNVSPSVTVDALSIKENFSEITTAEDFISDEVISTDNEDVLDTTAAETAQETIAEIFEDASTPEIIDSASFVADTADATDGVIASEDIDAAEEAALTDDNATENTVVEADAEEVLGAGEVAETSLDTTDESLAATEDLLDDVTIDTTLVATNTVVTTEAQSYTESDSVFSFSKEECTELATGSFYCHKPQENQLQDALYAAPDADGDLEIFLVRGGVQTQVTTNNVDDAAPYYDQNSHTIVWHRLIDDRYQIISYDITKASEQVLTKTSQNNMEPTRQGDYTVWQRWIDGGWNIILYDGSNETQITNTTSHNVAPYIHGSLVVWNRHDQVNDKTIEMYDMVSGTYVTVEDPDGMSVSNPRMVFVYDSLHPNGDIVTKGYDVLAKKFIDLDSLPRELPEEIPSSDSTGETRALIQLKPSGKSEVEEVLPTPGATSTTTATSSAPVATTTVPAVLEALTLDLTTATTTQPLPEVDFSYEIPPTELDLVIEPYSASSSSTDSVQE